MTGQIINIIIPGEPVGKGRPRFVRIKGFVSTYTDKKTKDYETLVKVLYKKQYGNFSFGEKPLTVIIKCYFAIPKATNKTNRAKMIVNEIKHTKRPDADNLAKSILDALNGLAYDDDSQIVALNVEKGYSETPHTLVTIYEH